MSIAVLMSISAEWVERRTLTERKLNQSDVTMTQSITAALPDLVRLHTAAKRDRQQTFNNLMHFITEPLLKKAYRALNKQAAAGIDGESWKSYGENITPKLQRLCQTLHSNGYKPRPVKRHWILKDNGEKRPLGITCEAEKLLLLNNQ